MLSDSAWRCKIRRHFLYLRSKQAKTDESEQRIYANPQERENMELCHQEAVVVMNEFMDGLVSLKHDAALEVGCGDARVTKD